MRIRWPQSDIGKILLCLVGVAPVLAWAVHVDEQRRTREDQLWRDLIAPTQTEKSTPPKSGQYDFNPNLRDKVPVLI